GLLLRRPSTEELERHEVVEDAGAPCAKDLEALLRDARPALGGIHQRADRAVGEREGDDEVVAGLHRGIRHAVTHGEYLDDIAPGEVAQRVDDVAARADRASAALLEVVYSVI